MLQKWKINEMCRKCGEITCDEQFTSDVTVNGTIMTVNVLQ